MSPTIEQLITLIAVKRFLFARHLWSSLLDWLGL